MTAETPETGTLALLDGTEVPYRPIGPPDQTALQRFHTRLSDRSVYQRFFGPRPWLSDDLARYFTHLDGIDRFALIALDPTAPEEIAAVVRFDREPGTDRAEYAAVVADRWQGHGLGLALTRRLIDAARRRGVRSFYALVLPENRPMLNLLGDLKLPEQIRHQDGVERIDVTLVPETPAS
jgi:RimJ/RimL family protein N-acetyltransferase